MDAFRHEDTVSSARNHPSSLLSHKCIPLWQGYAEATEAQDVDRRMIPPSAHMDGWRHNHSEPDGRMNSHTHLFFPPGRLGAPVKSRGVTTGEAHLLLCYMFPETPAPEKPPSSGTSKIVRWLEQQPPWCEAAE